MLSVVMPAHNEREYLRDSVSELVEGLRAWGRPFELVVVENGSTDGTTAFAEGLAAEVPELRVLSLPAPDYGAALRHGFLSAEGDVVANVDVDYWDVAFLQRAVALAEGPGGPAIVVGTKRGEGAEDHRSLARRVVTAGFSLLLKVGFGLQLSDTHGMKVLRRPPLVPLAEACRFGKDLFDTELVLRAERSGLRTAELPVVVEERRPSRSSIVRRAARTLVGLARLRVVLWQERPAHRLRRRLRRLRPTQG